MFTFGFSQRQTSFFEPELDFDDGGCSNARLGQEFYPSVGGGDLKQMVATFGNGLTAERGVAASKQRFDGPTRKLASHSFFALHPAERPDVMFINVEESGDPAMIETERAQDLHLLTQPRKPSPVAAALACR